MSLPMTKERFDELKNRLYWKQEIEPPDWYLMSELMDEIERLQRIVASVHEQALLAVDFYGLQESTIARFGLALGRIQEITKEEQCARV